MIGGGGLRAAVRPDGRRRPRPAHLSSTLPARSKIHPRQHIPPRLPSSLRTPGKDHGQPVAVDGASPSNKRHGPSAHGLRRALGVLLGSPSARLPEPRPPALPSARCGVPRLLRSRSRHGRMVGQASASRPFGSRPPVRNEGRTGHSKATRWGISSPPEQPDSPL